MPSAEAHRRAIALFHDALELPREEWESWLASRTGDDADLRADVLGLLEAHERTGGVLDRPAPDPTEAMVRTLRMELGDRYEILDEIGRGGMAVVLLARERKHDRQVALKVMRPEVAELYGRERFEQEVRLAAQLNHPHILGLIDSGEVGDLLFYVMPFIDGETLRERLDREGPLEAGTADRMMRQIAAALDHAHGMGVVHRDLKPANVLCAGDHTYIMDFGVAKTLESGSQVADLTAVGLALGTPRYMAPEQALGVAVDHRADLYAWGLMAFEMLTGDRGSLPVPGAESAALRRTMATRRDVAPGVVAVVERCLRPNPADRFQSAGAVIEALDAAVVGRPRTRPRLAWWKVGVVTAAAAAVGVFAFWPPGELPAGSILATPVAVAPFTNETGDPELDAVGRLAGDWIAQGLQQLGTLPVLPWPASLESAERARAEVPGMHSNLADYLAQDLGAGTVITGSIYRIGEDLQLGAVVTDVQRGRIVSAPEPIQVPAGTIHDGIRQLRDRLMGSLAISIDERFEDRPAIANMPPTFDSYRDFDRGVSAFLAQDYAVAAELFGAAWERDTTFLVARVYEARSWFNAGQRAEGDSVLAFLAPRRDRLSEYAALEADFLRAATAGQGMRALQLSRQAAVLGPNSRAAWNEAAMAIQLNRPRAALGVLTAIDPDKGGMRGWAQYWTQLAHAHHMVGDYEAEAGAASEMFRRYPERRVATVIRARALAAAGNMEGLETSLAETRILPPQDYWSYGAALVAAGIETAAHSATPGAGREYLEEAVDWLSRQLEVVPGDRGQRYWLAHAYYGLERWSEAELVLRELAREFPTRSNYLEFWALALARTTGDRDLVLARVGADPGFNQGDRLAYLARIEAVLGSEDRALAILSEALQTGVGDMSWLHSRAFHDFEPLRRDPRFVRLMGPE